MSYHFEALCSSIQSMLFPVKGLEIKQLEAGRILLCFNHIIDKQRATEGCPWSFDKNILILSAIGDSENPMQVDSERCDFYVHIHDLPLNMMNVGVAPMIGNRIGPFKDLEAPCGRMYIGSYTENPSGSEGHSTFEEGF
ncbi:UNVERIFIED_CONTAM: hypothetical protein Slati_1932400 [Sesamum latifolium]|uniref:Uncharacterized protein n=1 Tax=Sesamum latifolium TaxID=2727402 RepID=A0AAW2X235_9LAMI